MSSKKEKRRGKTFVTHHYIPHDMCAALYKAFTHYAHKLHSWEHHALSFTKEISCWADPRGILFYFGQGALPRVPYDWSEFGLTDEEIHAILFGMKKCYEQYGEHCKDRQFKIVLNGEMVDDLIRMMEL